MVEGALFYSTKQDSKEAKHRKVRTKPIAPRDSQGRSADARVHLCAVSRDGDRRAPIRHPMFEQAAALEHAGAATLCVLASSLLTICSGWEAGSLSSSPGPAARARRGWLMSSSCRQAP